MQQSYREIAYQGLWGNNAALVQLLGLCPLLAVSNSAVNAAGLGVATIFVLAGSNVMVSLSRRLLIPAVRLWCSFAATRATSSRRPIPS